jgi:hypothetical protein
MENFVKKVNFQGVLLFIKHVTERYIYNCNNEINTFPDTPDINPCIQENQTKEHKCTCKCCVNRPWYT